MSDNDIEKKSNTLDNITLFLKKNKVVLLPWKKYNTMTIDVITKTVAND